MFGDFWCDVYSLWRFLFLRRKLRFDMVVMLNAKIIGMKCIP
jgi:hypothetical protein